MESFLTAQYREEIISKVKTESIEDLPRFEVAVSTVKNEIVAEKKAIEDEERSKIEDQINDEPGNFDLQPETGEATSTPNII